MPWFNLCKMVPSHSSQIFVYAKSFEKLLQNICPFCILFICFHFLYQFINLKFPHLPFGCQNLRLVKWVFLRSSLITFDKIQPWVIISLNLHYFLFALYNFHIGTLIAWIPQILCVKLNTMKNICKWFQLNG